jgi:hypothetical protein
MAHGKFDLVQETSTSAGTGAIALAGAVTRRRRFGDVLANGDTCYVLIEHASAAEWEIGLATWNTGHSLTRGAVSASSTGSAVNFSAGTKTITLIAPAAKSLVEDNNGDVPVTRDVAVGRNLTAAGAALAQTGIGYASGAGGTVTQGTSKATGVTLSKASGKITLHNAALAAATIVSFVLTNTLIAAGDVLVLNHVATGTPGSYSLNARCAAGSATIDVRNNTAGSLSEAIDIQFVLVKGVTS